MFPMLPFVADEKKFELNFGERKIFINFVAESPNGGIGRRVGLKHRWSNPCRFDSGFGYHQINKARCP